MVWPFLAIVLYREFQLQATEVGLILSAAAVGAAATGFYIGILSDRIEPTSHYAHWWHSRHDCIFHYGFCKSTLVIYSSDNFNLNEPFVLGSCEQGISRRLAPHKGGTRTCPAAELFYD